MGTTVQQMFELLAWYYGIPEALFKGLLVNPSTDQEFYRESFVYTWYRVKEKGTKIPSKEVALFLSLSVKQLYRIKKKVDKSPVYGLVYLDIGPCL